MTRLTEANYPESTRRVFVINGNMVYAGWTWKASNLTLLNLNWIFETVPQVFAVIWNMVKPFLHQITIDKVRIFGTDVNEWKAALLEEIDPDQLPTHYGGTQMDPDGNARCLTKVHVIHRTHSELLRFYHWKTAFKSFAFLFFPVDTSRSHWAERFRNPTTFQPPNL